MQLSSSLINGKRCLLNLASLHGNPVSVNHCGAEVSQTEVKLGQRGAQLRRSWAKEELN
jgi:hypothetical protein